MAEAPTFPAGRMGNDRAFQAQKTSCKDLQDADERPFSQKLLTPHRDVKEVSSKVYVRADGTGPIPARSAPNARIRVGHRGAVGEKSMRYRLGFFFTVTLMVHLTVKFSPSVTVAITGTV